MKTVLKFFSCVPPAVLLALGCVGAAGPGAGGGGDNDDSSATADDDDGKLVLPPESKLHGSYPAANLELPQFEALNSDGSVRGPDHLRGHPTVMWFFPFAGTPV